MATTAAITPTTTGAATSGSITVADGASIQVYATAKLGLRETVKVERTYDAGTSWVRLDDGDSDEIILREGKQSGRIVGPATVRLVKSPTVNSMLIYYDS